jgi:formate--tetrahydrofolate ligase
MAVLLKDALLPNLVQSIEHSPAFIHGGPFANIAHGCNSVTATKAALGLNDVVVTEAGFGADLGAEKFIDIKCRHAGLAPEAAVLVCTVRALKMHGGVAKSALGTPDVEAVRRGCANLARHIRNLARFGLTPVVAINHFATDTARELDVVRGVCADLGVRAVLATHWAEGGAGAEALAAAVLDALEGPVPTVTPLYGDDLALADKVRTVATALYGAADIALSDTAARAFREFEAMGFGHLPVCIAKTQYSFSADPTALGAPAGHVLPVREARLAAGAGFVVAICGDVMTMPGLPRRPAALDIGLDDAGNVVGLS